MPNGAARAAPSDNTRATRNTTPPPTPLSSRVMKGMRSTTTADGEALSAELNIQARLTKDVRPNGSRLRCGRRARGRKVVEQQIRRLAGETTRLLPACERPAAS